MALPTSNLLILKVTVRFADGAAPASASFWLVGHTSRGTRRVEVFRQPRPPDVLKKGLRARRSPGSARRHV
ncbi:DUF2381 family protein [Archangium violaceum]|uniref:DUF2381 family protein n=1 Tax=Archangium violaceum TaxID=83451 RepID=UPI0009FDC1E2|nr:DUF2381 family protein [Archangium violaceum]